MKKNQAIMILFVFLPEIVFSQMYLGVKGGLNLGWYSGEHWQEYVNNSEQNIEASLTDSNIPLPNLGIFFDAMITSSIGLSTNININAYGEDCIINDLSFQKLEFRQNVIEMPILLKLTTSNYFSEGMYCVLGPVIQYLFRGYEIKLVKSGETIDDQLYFRDRKFVLGILGGIGYEWPNRNGLFKIDITYGRNLTKPLNDTNYPFEVINNVQVNCYYGSRLHY